MMEKNNIILFATYWNEIDWIKASLKQIDIINPIEIIICDGCFDSKYPNRSTDGTRKIIKSFVNKRENARLISAVRVDRFTGVIKMLRGHKKSRFISKFSPARWKAVYKSMKDNIYRVNQALTFQYMISISKLWKPGRWFMVYDCDQFYLDEMIEKFKICNKKTKYGLLTSYELTFFQNFQYYTADYEKRNFNNMPHKIYKDTSIWPTRDLVIENFSFAGIRPRKFFENELYINKVESKDIGFYFHYKMKSSARFEQGYKLGDRVKPDISKYKLKEFKGTHPRIIREYFLKRKEFKTSFSFK